MPIISRLGGSGGGSGTAQASDILLGKTAWVSGKKLTGAMPNNGSISKTLNAKESFTIPSGYHDGTGIITAAPETGYKFFNTSKYIKYGAHANGEVLCSTGLGNVSVFYVLFYSDNDGYFAGTNNSYIYGVFLSNRIYIDSPTDNIGIGGFAYVEFENGNIVLHVSDSANNNSLTLNRSNGRDSYDAALFNIDIFYK